LCPPQLSAQLGGDIVTTSLPIVERELRIAARKKSTFWVRIIAAFTGVTIAGGILVLQLAFSKSGGGGFGIQLGSVLFSILTWMSLAAALSAGVFFTSDCLSEEKREGTLGFLFLTDLRGYDVVFGKLLATSLRGFFALLSIFPVLAITFMLGGVTGEAFWKTMLALANALFFSLAIGMLVSAMSRDSQRALIATVLVMLLFNLAGPVMDGVMVAAYGKSFGTTFSLGSPWFVFMSVGTFTSDAFWQGLVVTQIIAWLCLVAACLLLPRSWQEKKLATTSVARDWSYTLKFGGVKSRERLRQLLMTPNPVVWLACRERWQPAIMWAIALLTVAGVIAILTRTAGGLFDMTNYFVGGLMAVIFYLWVSSQSCRFLVDARKSGLLELLLSSPLKDGQIVRGQWNGLKRQFGWPVFIYLAAQLTGAVYTQLTTNMNVFAMIQNAALGKVFAVISTVLGTVVVLANLITLAWFGMWMGLASRNTNLATLKTLLFVQIIPWFVITFVSTLGLSLLMMTMAMSGAQAPTSLGPTFGAWFTALYSVVPLVLTLLKDVAFTMWARKKLHNSFRERATQAIMPVRLTAPPAPRMPPTMSVPPPLPAQR